MRLVKFMSWDVYEEERVEVRGRRRRPACAWGSGEARRCGKRKKQREEATRCLLQGLPLANPLYLLPQQTQRTQFLCLTLKCEPFLA